MKSTALSLLTRLSVAAYLQVIADSCTTLREVYLEGLVPGNPQDADDEEEEAQQQQQEEAGGIGDDLYSFYTDWRPMFDLSPLLRLPRLSFLGVTPSDRFLGHFGAIFAESGWKAAPANTSLRGLALGFFDSTLPPYCTSWPRLLGLRHLKLVLNSDCPYPLLFKSLAAAAPELSDLTLVQEGDSCFYEEVVPAMTALRSLRVASLELAFEHFESTAVFRPLRKLPLLEKVLYLSMVSNWDRFDDDEIRPLQVRASKRGRAENLPLPLDHLDLRLSVGCPDEGATPGGHPWVPGPRPPCYDAAEVQGLVAPVGVAAARASGVVRGYPDCPANRGTGLCWAADDDQARARRPPHRPTPADGSLRGLPSRHSPPLYWQPGLVISSDDV